MQLIYVYVILFCLFENIDWSLQECTAVDDCSCRFPNGSEVALHQLDKKNSVAFSDIPTNKADYLASYNPCTPFVKEKGCHDVLACQYLKDGTAQYPLAMPDTHTFVVRDDGNINIQYSATTDVTRNFIVKLTCDMSITTPEISPLNEHPPDTYTLAITHKCACAGACSSNDSPSDSGKSLSTGSLLCILLIVFVVVYFVGGILFLKFYKKNEGVDVIPNREFWMDFPAKVKDGFKFTWGKVKKKDEYESI